MASQNSNSGGSSSGFFDKLVSFVTDPMGMAVTGAAVIAITAVLYVGVF